MNLAGVFLICSALLSYAAPAQSACMTYGGRISLHGTLTRQVFPGPPGYESIARGDKPETYYVLRLQPPGCVVGNPTDPDQPAVDKITDIQLVLRGKEQYASFRPLIDKQIVLSGSLFAAETGHHHTPVLLSDVQIEAH
jgi:hypothetical protein